jgi:outer membrane protein, multidrug efflux system
MPAGADPAAPAASGGWWKSFASPSLSVLVDRALAANLGLEERRLRLHEARLDPAVPRSWLWPVHLDVQGSFSRYREVFASEDQNVSGTFSEADLFAVAAYDLDLAGRRAALRAAADQREEALRNSGESFALATAAEVATVWFALVEERSQRALLARQLDEGTHLLDLVQARVDQQLASRLDLLQQRVQVATVRALVPQVEARQGQLESRLAELLGEERGRRNLPPDLALPALPPRPALDVATLIERRPDVKEAQARVAEVEQRRRAQLATWVPSVQLFVRGGLRSYQPADFVNSPVWGLGAQLTWPLFDGGQRSVEVSRLEVEARRLRIQHAEVVLKARREVDDAVIAEEKTGALLGELQAELETARATLDEAKARYQHGLSDYTPVVTTLRIVGELERTRLSAQGQLLAARVRLHEVLAGDWMRDAVDGPATRVRGER